MLNSTGMMLFKCTAVIVFFRYSDVDYCENNQCQNGATCKEASNSYVCECVAGFKGDMCETGRHQHLHRISNLAIDLNCFYIILFKQMLCYVTNVFCDVDSPQLLTKKKMLQTCEIIVE